MIDIFINKLTNSIQDRLTTKTFETDIDVLIQSPALNQEDDNIIRDFIKKSKASQRRRELYAKRKMGQLALKQAATATH